MAKQQDPLRSIYNDLGLEQAGIGYDKFSTKFMADSNARRSVYNDLGLEQAGINYNLFEERLGVKKKDLSQSASQSGLEISGQPSVPSPEFEASNAAYAAEADARLPKPTITGVMATPQAPEISASGFGSSISGAPSTFGDLATNAHMGLALRAYREEPEPVQQAKRGFFQDIFTSLRAGSAAIGEGITSIPDLVYSLAATPQNMLADLLEGDGEEGKYDWLRADYDQAVQGSPLASLSRISKEYGRLSDDARSRVTQFENDIIGSIGSGNFGDAGRQVANAIVESVPSIMAMVASGGASAAAGGGRVAQMAAQSIPFASGEYQALEGDENIPDSVKPIIALAKGATEVIFEGSFGTAALVRNIVDKKTGVRGAQQFLKGYFDRALESTGVPASVFKGSVSEASTTLAQNLITKFSGENPEQDLWEGVADAAIIGGVMDSAIATPSAVGRFIDRHNDRKAAVVLSESNNKILEDLSNPGLNIPADQRLEMMRIFDENTAKLENYINESEAERGKLTPAQRQLREQMTERDNSLQQIIDNPDVSEGVKAAVQADLDVVQQAAERQQEVDSAIIAFQEANPEIEVDYLEDLPDSVVTTFERVESGLPADPTAIDEASTWMYNKYQELTALKTDPNRRLTIEQIEGIQEQLGEDITLLENYKLEQHGEGTETTEVQPETAADTVADQAVQEASEERGSEAVEQPETAADGITPETGEVVSQPPADTSTATPAVVEESGSQPGQYFTRDIGGEQTVYRRNEDGTASIVPESEAQNILSQQTEQGQSIATERESLPVAEPLSEQRDAQAQDGLSRQTEPDLTEESRIENREDWRKLPSDFSTEEQYYQYVSQESMDPEEVAAAYTAVPKGEPGYVEQQIAEYLGSSKINERDYNRWGDANQMDDKRRRRWINRKDDGISLDVMAQELSDQAGVEITPADFIEFVDNYMSLKDMRDHVETDLERALKARYRELTGNNLTPRRADRAARQFNPNFTNEEIYLMNQELHDIGVTYEDIVNYEEFNRQRVEADAEAVSETQNEQRGSSVDSGASQAAQVENQSQVNEEAPQQEAVQEAEQAQIRDEAVQESEDSSSQEGGARVKAPKKKKTPTIQQILKSPEARQNRLQELRNRISEYNAERSNPDNLGIARDPKRRAEYWRDVTDYAAIRIVDGAISTARQLAAELGITESSDLNKAFREARKIVSADNDLSMTTARNADTARKRAEFGFDERIPVVRVASEEVASNAREIIENGYDIDDLVNRVLSGEAITDLEVAILTQHVASQEAKIIKMGDDIESVGKYKTATGFNKLVNARNNALDELLRSYEALEFSGTVAARALNIRKQLANRDISLARMIVDYRKARGGVVVSDSDMNRVRAKYEEMKKVADRIRERNEMLERENLELNALLASERIQAEIRAAKEKTKQRKTKQEAIQDIRKNRAEKLLPEFKASLRAAFNLDAKGFAVLSENEVAKEKRLAKATYELVKSYIQEYLDLGRKYSVSDIVDRLHAEILEVAPNVTRDQVMNLIDASNPERRQTRSDLQNEVRLFRTEIRIMREIERLEKGGGIRERMRSNPTERSTRLDELRKRLKSIRENIRNQNNPDDSTRPTKRESDDYNFDKQKKSLQDRIKDYQERIKNKDFAPEKKQLVLEDSRLKNLRRELDELQHRFKVEVRKEELKRRGLMGRVVDIAVETAAIPRTLLATGDLSAMFRQLMFVAASRPATFARVFGKMHQFWWSEKAYDDYFADFKDSDAFVLAQKSGLAMTDLAKNINADAREEMFMSNSLSKIEEMTPILGKRTLPVKAFGKTFNIPGLGLHSRAERGFTGAVNKMRIDLFNHGAEMLMQQGKYPDMYPKEYKQLATYVNAATGRGPMPERYSGVMKDLSAVFFAPRLATSRMYLLSGAPVASNSVVRKMYARDLVTFLGFGMSAIWLASLMGADTEDDPTSVDFGMIRFGDRRYDPWGGFSQYARFAARMITGKVTSSTGRTKILNSDEYGAMTYADLMGRFFRGKFSPTMSLLYSASDGKNYMGEPFEWRQEIWDSVRPLIIQDVQEAWTEMDEGAWSLLTTGLPAFYGVGVNAWRANAFLDRGVDDKLIELTNSKKVATLIPEEGRIRITDLETGEDRKLTSDEYQRYLDKWSDYIKKDLNDNYERYKAMSSDRFQDEFDNIKSRATAYTKERISGVSPHDKSFSEGGKTYMLTPEQLQKRVQYNKEYIADNEWRLYDRADRLQDNGMSREMALIEARKWINSQARAYSKRLVMEEFEGRLSEKE